MKLIEWQKTTSFWKHAELTKRIICSQGGTSAGKTYSILQILFIIALKNSEKEEQCLISIISETMPHLKRGAMRDFFNLLLSQGLYSESNHNRSDSTYQLGGSTIEFFSADQHDKLRGARRDYLFINECNNITYEAFQQLEVRTRKRIYLDYNPVSEFWVHEKILTLPDSERDFIITTYQDNEALDEQIKRSIEVRRERDPNWWHVYGLGLVGKIEGLIFSDFELVDSIPEVQGYGMDFGFTNDPTTLTACALIGDNLYLDELLYQTALTTPEIIGQLKTLAVGNRKEILADSSDPRMIEEIRRAGFNIHPAVKGQGSVEHGIDSMKRYKLHVTKRSTNLIKELRNYKWKEDKEGKIINEPIDFFNHSIDGARYYVAHRTARPKQSGPSRSMMVR